MRSAARSSRWCGTTGRHITTIAVSRLRVRRSDRRRSPAPTGSSTTRRSPRSGPCRCYDELVAKVTVDRAARRATSSTAASRRRSPRCSIATASRIVPIAGQPRVDVEVFRATKVTSTPPFEGRTRATFEGAWTRETRTLDRGAIFVPIASTARAWCVHLLDPALPDSLAQWGELRRRVRAQGVHGVVRRRGGGATDAREGSRARRAQFDAAIAADPELAKSPEKRLDWFYRHHPAWDERVNLLPVYRTDRIP